MVGYYYGAKAANAAWQEKGVRWLTVGLLAYAGYKLATVYGKVADTAIAVIDLPKKFLEDLLHGWNDQAPDSDSLNNFNAILKTIKINPSNLKYTATAYITIANSLETAMTGLGTNWNLFQSSLNDINNDDFKAVWIAFGLRKGSGFFQSYQNLTQWMEGDLSETNYATYQRIFKDSGLL